MSKAPFDVQDYKSSFGNLYVGELVDTKTGESIALLTVDQSLQMKQLIQLWHYHEQFQNQNSVAQKVFDELHEDGDYGEYALGSDLWNEFKESFSKK